MKISKISKILKILKAIFFTITGLIVLYILALLVLKNSINTKRLKKQINYEITEKILEYNEHHLFEDKEIKFFIRGNMSLVIFPKPKLVINDFIMENIQYRDILVNGNIRKVEIFLDFNKFIRKKLEFKDINISGTTLFIENNKLPDFYITKKIVKKIVKLDDNEVFGVRDKLKNILMGNETSMVDDGYKEIEVAEDTRIDLDNEKLKSMVVDLFKIIKGQEFNFEKNIKVNFSNFLVNMVKEGNIQKEFKYVNGNLNILTHLKEIRLKLDFMLNNINGFLNIKTKEKDDNFTAELSLTNGQNDKIELDFSGNNLLTNTIDKINGDFKFFANIANFNNFIQWALPVDSPFYYRFDYKKAIEYSTNVKKTGEHLVFNDLRVKAEDIDITGSVYLEDENKIDLNIQNMDFDQFIINTAKLKNNTKADDILIFKYSSLEELVENIPKMKKKTDNASIKLTIKKLIKNSKVLKDSVLDFEIIDNNFRINNVKLDFDDFNFVIENKQNINDYYYNNLEIKGSNFRELSRIFNAEDIIKINNFDLTSKIFIYNNIIYLYDIVVKDEDKDKISGSFEYSFSEKNKFLAGKITIRDLDVKIEENKSKTLKEKFLWLNNFTNEIFLDLTINNLSFNNYKNIFFDSKIQYSTGFINLYHIKDIKFEDIESIKGNLLLTVNEKFPRISANLFIDKMSKEIDLLKHIFDVEKYKSIVLDTKINQEDFKINKRNVEINKENQQKYWVNELFNIPTWNEINGDIILQFKDLKINESIFSNVYFNSKIEDGLILINNLNLVGLGGSTELRGQVDLKVNKTFNLVLTETIYNIEDIFKLIFPKYEQDFLTGTVGIGGIFKANGFNSSIFLASMNLQAKFVGQNLFIKKLGFDDLRKKLSEVYTNKELLDNFKTKEFILNSTGTTFKNFNGSLILAKGVSNLTLECQGNDISNKLISKIDNSSDNITIDMINTSVLMTKVGKSRVPLYVTIGFKEDFNNKANLVVNTSQIDEYLDKIREKEK